MSIKTKAELDIDILTKFPDNTQGLISAQRLRDYLFTVNDSLLIQRTEQIDMVSDPYNVPPNEVTENVLHTTSGADRIINLPSAVGLDNQSFVMIALDNSLVNVQSPDPVIGDANFSEPVLVSYRANGGEWLSLPIYLSRKDTVEIGITFNEPGNLTAGEEMRLGNTEGQNNEGWVAPYAGKLTKCTISRGNAALADIDISVNGALEDTVMTSTLKSTHDINIPVAEGDSIMVLGGATTPNPLTQPVIVLILRKNEA